MVKTFQRLCRAKISPQRDRTVKTKAIGADLLGIDVK